MKTTKLDDLIVSFIYNIFYLTPPFFKLNEMVVALSETITHSNEHLNIKRKRHNSGINFFRYAHNRQIRKHNNICLKCLGASLNSIAESYIATDTRGSRIIIT